MNHSFDLLFLWFDKMALEKIIQCLVLYVLLSESNANT